MCQPWFKQFVCAQRKKPVSSHSCLLQKIQSAMQAAGLNSFCLHLCNRVCNIGARSENRSLPRSSATMYSRTRGSHTRIPFQCSLYWVPNKINKLNQHLRMKSSLQSQPADLFQPLGLVMDCGQGVWGLPYMKATCMAIPTLKRKNLHHEQPRDLVHLSKRLFISFHRRFIPYSPW